MAQKMRRNPAYPLPALRKGSDVQIDPTKQLDSFHLTLAPMTREDVPRLHELSVSVRWPHRPEDWATVIGLGHGLIMQDEIGRVAGSAMWFPLGQTHASIGMVITSPRLQDHGAGRWLMGHIMAQTGDRALVLNATRAAYRLYLSLGFTPMEPVSQHNGIVSVIPPGPDHARALTPDDAAELVALDAQTQGVARPDVIAALLRVSDGTVVTRDGAITGFALCRRFGRGRVVGPIVATSPEDAIALVRPHLVSGRFLRVDTREAKGPFRDFLVAAGIGHYDSVTRMHLGAPPQPTGPARLFGLVNQALG